MGWLYTAGLMRKVGTGEQEGGRWSGDGEWQ